MEQVYLAGIAAFGIVALAAFLLLRRRLTGANLSVKKGDLEAQASLQAATPGPDGSPAGNRRPHSPTPSGVRDIVQIGRPLIRVIRGVSVFRVFQLGRGRIEVTEQDTRGAAKPRR